MLRSVAVLKAGSDRSLRRGGGGDSYQIFRDYMHMYIAYCHLLVHLLYVSFLWKGSQRHLWWL